jgi:hypothetical protein
MKAAFFKYVTKNTVDFAMISVAVSIKRSQREAKIVVGGEFEEGLARLNPDGSFDETFHPPSCPLMYIGSAW